MIHPSPSAIYSVCQLGHIPFRLNRSAVLMTKLAGISHSLNVPSNPNTFWSLMLFSSPFYGLAPLSSSHLG